MTVASGRLSGMDAVFAGGGEAGDLMARTDWAKTPLGPVSRWPQSLRSAVSICLLSRFPMVVWWGPELVFIYNDAYRPILGNKSPAHVMGEAGSNVWPEIWDVIGPMLDGVITRGEATWSDDQVLYLDRSGYVEECYFTFSYSPVRDETGGVGGVFTAVTETTSRVLGERRLLTLSTLAESTAGARSAEEACAAAAATLSANPADLPFSEVYLVEPGGLARVGASGAAPHGVDWPLSEVAESREARVVEGFGDGAGGVDKAIVLPVLQSGSTAAVLVAGISPRRALDDAYRRFYDLVAAALGTAIADARAYETERRRAEALAELDRAKTAFFSNVSHEFRTPLTLLLGPLEEALARVNGPERGPLEVAHRNATRLLRLVNTLLDFSRIEAGRLDASFRPVDLARLTADLASAFRSAVEGAGLELRVDCPELPERAYVDVDMWEKIVLNLLSNAFKFTFEGRIEVALALVGGRFELTVSDTGVGVPEPELPRLFDRFHRIRESRSRTHEGSGIGLALVRELVELHGGEIDVSSRLGEGTSFRVSIPAGSAHLPADRVVNELAIPSTAVSAAPYVDEALRWLPGRDSEPEILWTGGLEPEPPVRGTEPAAVLVVDDNADMRDYLVGLLGRHWEVHAVGDGVAALEALAARRFDLVLTDVMLPRLDGFGLVRAIREDPATEQVPIVMLSARAGDEATVEGLRAGADDYLAKPFAARELVARIRANLELARMRTLARDVAAQYDQSGRALERALLSIAAIAKHVGARAGLEQLYGGLSATVADLVEAGMVIFWRLEDGEIRAQPAAYGTRADAMPILRAPVTREGDSVADRIVFHGEVFNGRISDTEQFANRPMLDALGAVDMIGVPWRSGDEPLGLLAVYNSLKPGGFTQDDVWVVRIAALAAALVVEHGRAQSELSRLSEREAGRLRAAVTRSAELERVKSEFLKLASHELRGPLAVLRGYLSMIEDGSLGETSPAVREVLPVLSAKVREMVLLVDQMLETARLEDDKLELKVERLDLREVVDSAIATIAPLVPKSHRLRVRTAPAPVPVDGDAARLATAISNLVDNAVRYSPEGGDVEIRCAVRGARRQAVVEVRDHGLGISREDLPRLFTRFGRIVTKDNSHIPGTGLGLYFAREIARMHGGSITVVSEPGVGSRFTFSVPLASAPAPAERPPAVRAT